MMQTIIFYSLSVVWLNPITAQQPGILKFQSLNQVGLLKGESAPAFHLQSVNGLQYKDWFMGIGAGLDYYRFRGVPLFFDLRKYIGRKKRQFFLYAGAGAHFVWEKEEKQFNTAITYHPGFYSNTGIGFKAGLKNGMEIVMNAGYTCKRINQTREQTICPFSGPCYLQADKYNYGLNRFIIQIGWMF